MRNCASTITLPAYLNTIDADPALSTLILAVSQACSDISALISQGALAGILGAANTDNVQGEEQKALDVISNKMIADAADACGQVAAIASEEMEGIIVFDNQAERGRNLLLFDPLDGSSNIGVNVSIGTIFSVLPAPLSGPEASHFLLPGSEQLAAGYVLYGPQTTLMLTLKDGVIAFTLDKDASEWCQIVGEISVPPVTNEFAINMSNMRHWADPVRAYITDCLAGETGDRGKDFNMRWIGSMVAEVHRILARGGVFLYPWDSRVPSRPGRLRLMYEANPMALLIERAGGSATDAYKRILNIQPTSLHQRVAVVLGSMEEVDRVTAAHRRVE